MPNTTRKPMADWTEQERKDLRALSQAVYPPDEADDWAGKSLDWADADVGVASRDDDERLVSYIGVFMRRATHDERSVLVGGVGQIKTHPEARGQGLATAGLRQATDYFTEHNASFALLVCEDGLIPFYARRGWRDFDGRLLTLQKGRTSEFTFNRVMVLDVCESAPTTGTIDLLGPPW